MSIFSRLGRVWFATLLVGVLLTTGCTPQQQQAGDHNSAHIQDVPVQGLTPLRSTDMPAFENALFQKLSVSAAYRTQFRILETKNVPNGTYVLYQLPNSDGLAFAGRDANGRVVIRKAHWPFTVTDKSKDLVVVRAIPPNNSANPTYGVLAGRVYSPFIETIEINYRDGHQDRIDVTHTRGFIVVRKAFDTRFVEVRGYGMNGNGYWSIDTR